MRLKSVIHRLNRKDQPILKINHKFFNAFVLILAATTSIFFVHQLYAQATSTTASTNPFLEFQDATKDNANANRILYNSDSIEKDYLLTGNDIIWDIKSQSPAFLTGKAFDENGHPTAWVPGGAVGSASNIIGFAFTPPASGIQYIASIKDNLLGKPAYAQGSGAGFTGLQPILPIWKGFRNVVYILSSIFFIIIAIMIVLRVKISPQAVISIQNAIPQLVTTLILVTFSYAIAGLLIDLSYIVQGVAISALFSATGTPINQSLFPVTVGKGALYSGFSQIFSGNASYSLNDLVAHNGFLQTFDLTSRLLPLNVIVIFTAVSGAIIGGFFGTGALGPGLGTAAGALGGSAVFSILVLLIISIFILIKLIGFLFSLIKVYINVILSIILAPFQIGIGAFPGSKSGFSTWFWDLVSNLAVFPFTLLFLVFVNIIIEKVQLGGLWTPPLMGVAFQNGALGGKIIAAFIGIGAFILLSKLPELIPQLVFNLKPSPWGTAIGQANQKPLDLAKAGIKQASHNEFVGGYDRATQAGQTPTAFDRAGKLVGNIMELTGNAKSR